MGHARSCPEAGSCREVAEYRHEEVEGRGVEAGGGGGRYLLN